jgi:hypothetical protein
MGFFPSGAMQRYQLAVAQSKPCISFIEKYVTQKSDSELK